MNGILHKIIEEKKREVEHLHASPLHSATSHVPRGFRQALFSAPDSRIIAEIKRASPSKGIIRQDFDAVSLARSYFEGGARCISVLTDEKFFQGSLSYLGAIRSALPELRLLRKDFIIDPLQLLETRAAGADACLLIVAALSPEKLQELFQEACRLELDVLIEVHNSTELLVAANVLQRSATSAGVASRVLLGINNRDLQTFAVSLDISRDLAKQWATLVSGNPLFASIPLISESGIESSENIAMLRAFGISGFLVGESLMRLPHPGEGYRELAKGL